MKIEVLISTMNLSSYDDYKLLLNNMNIDKQSITINQCPNQDNLICDIENNDNRLFSYKEKGLSKSRNLAIEKSNSDICVIADDDLVYENNFEDIITRAYKKYKDADIIAFDVESTNLDRPTTKQCEGKKMYFGAMKISSFQITFKHKSIIEKKIRFDERFGAGSGKFTAGEENIFLFDALKKGLKIYYVPEKIATVDHKESTWFKGFDKRYFETIGASYYRMSNKFYYLMIMQYAIRKHNKYKNKLSFSQAIKYMNQGKKRCTFKPFFVGDFKTDTGPAIVNKNLKKCIKDKALYSDCTNNILRVFEVVFKIIQSDCVMFCSFSNLNVLGIIISKLLNKKTFYLMHGRINYENEINNRENRLIKKSEDYILNNVDQIICVSKILYEEIKNINNKWNVDYVFNGIDYENVIIKEKINRNNNLILSTGGLMPRKNNIKICEAIESINKSNEYNLKYIIIGEDFGNLELINRYDFVEYISSIPHSECLKHMKASKLYIQNSLYETFGLAVVEAVANGCDLLVSKNVGAKDIFPSLTKEYIIGNVNDIEEIKNKIINILKNGNNEELLSTLKKNKTDIYYRGNELMNLMEETVYE